MITCNRCGNMSPVSAVNCQTCGAPLSSKVGTGPGPSRMAAPQEQSGLPAWLESLRAGERPAAPINNSSDFSPADLIEDGALPSWMRAGGFEANEGAASSPLNTLRPASHSGPDTDDSKGINAKSLIDESALPSWMKENKQTTGSIPQGGIAASSLLQPDGVPNWMKTLQPQQSQVASPTPPTMRPGSSQSPYLSGPYNQAAQPVKPGSELPTQSSQGLSARELIDQQSLPQWMTNQGEKNPATPAGTPPSANQSPSSLLDMDSLPSWLRENGQQQGQRSGGFPPVQPDQAWQSAPSTMQTPPAQLQSAPPPMQMIPPTGQSNNSLSASSFIDPNSLPEWLRSGTEQRQPGTPMPQNPRTSYNVPPRVENMRVPSRPRGEINPNEGNEAAANVFASMLGVASATPNLPAAGQPAGGVPSSFPPSNMPGQMSGPMQGFAGSQEPQQPQSYSPGGYSSGIYQSGNSPQQGNGYQLGNSPQQGNGYQLGNLPQQGNGYQSSNSPQQPQSYAPGGYSSGVYQSGNSPQQGNGYQPGNPLQQGNYQIGNSPAGANQYPMGGPGMSAMPPMGMAENGMSTDQRYATKPAKKGFFETIRDWFR